MATLTSLTRTAAFSFATVATAAVGRVGFLENSAFCLSWPAAGVIVFWILVIRSRREFAAFAVVTAVSLTLLDLATGADPVHAVTMALANVTLGLGTRWSAALLVRADRRFGVSRYLY